METRPEPQSMVPIYLLGGLLVAAAIYIILLRRENADLRAQRPQGATAAHAAVADPAPSAPTPTPTPTPSAAPRPTPGGIPAPADVGSVPVNAARTPSGLASRVITPGASSRHPTASSRVEVHYTGWTTDGGMFDSSVQRGSPAQFPLSGVIRGWTEGVQLMVEGETRRFWIPAALAYGEHPGGGRPGGMLVFDIKLLRIME